MLRATEPETKVTHLSKCVTEQGRGSSAHTAQGPFPSTGCPAVSCHAPPFTLCQMELFLPRHVVLLLGKKAAGLEVTKGVLG